jgi:hypothetical protein
VDERLVTDLIAATSTVLESLDELPTLHDSTE